MRDLTKSKIKCVLLIDDDIVVRMMIERLLLSAGVQVIEQASDGDKALDILRATPKKFQLILSDLKMPGTDGIGLLRDVCTIAPQVPMAFISSAEDEIMRSAERLALQRGVTFVGCLSKPVTSESLASIINRASQVIQEGPVEVKEKPDWSQHDRPWLEKMLTDGRLRAYVQPQVRLSDGSLFGVEVLARFEPDSGFPLPPVSFIPLAERCGLIDELTYALLAIVREAQTTWGASGLKPFISVNFSASTLTNLDVFERISDSQNLNVDLSNFVVEITETMATDAGDDLLDVATRLRLNGIHLSIDDFGTGYSSLSQLTDLPFSELKLDQSFVLAATQQESARKIVMNTLRMAHDLGLRVVAEGVETADHWNLMRELGCDVAQGYHIARPMPWQDLVRWSELFVPQSLIGKE